MKTLLSVFLLICSAVIATAQVPLGLKTVTVSQLPDPADAKHKIYRVSDGSLANDCTVGSGSTAVICASDGSTWTAITAQLVPKATTVNGYSLNTNVSLVKGDIGLGNVDNTSDASKPVSTATQTALDAKQALDTDLTTIAGLTATTDNFLVSVASAWASRTPAQVKSTLALVKGDVGLGNVDNTSDATKFTSTALTGTPTAPTAAAGTNTTQVATTAFVTAINNNASYRTILEAAGSHTAAKAGGTYAMGYGDPIAVSGTGTLYPLAVIQIVAADYPTINGLATKLRIRAQVFTNDVAPTGNYTFGLYPITRPGTSGGAGLAIYTLGTVVSGSNGATFTTPAADSLLSGVSSEFALPADGPYVIGIVTTATVATSAHVHLNAQLQMRNP